MIPAADDEPTPTPALGTIIHVRDRVMTSCIAAIVHYRPPVMEVKPGDTRSAEGNILWVTLFTPTGAVADAARRSRVADGHWHLIEDCPGDNTGKSAHI